MSKVEWVKIEQFWGDKEVNIKLKEDVNFLIGVNGSGKTTIINLIAATLKADFPTLDRTNFKKIHIELTPQIINNSKKTAHITVEKESRQNSSYPFIVFSVKSYNSNKAKSFDLNEIEGAQMYRSRHDYYYFIGNKLESYKSDLGRDINLLLSELVNVTWLTIHRTSSVNRLKEERSYESTIDQKIEELQIDLGKYFATLTRKYALETEAFQKHIFESLLDANFDLKDAFEKKINVDKERDALKEIFNLFKLNENAYSKLDNYFDSYRVVTDRLKNKKELKLEDVFYLVNTRKIHGVVQRWQALNEKKTSINQSKEVFLKVINNLLERKELFINDKNELTVKTQSGKVFPLTTLSSGEKQLLIILGQSLLEEEREQIYIADEPELSLHVAWQEKLVTSLKSINPNSQIIFATHSPDIVGNFQTSLLNVEEGIK